MEAAVTLIKKYEQDKSSFKEADFQVNICEHLGVLGKSIASPEFTQQDSVSNISRHLRNVLRAFKSKDVAATYSKDMCDFMITVMDAELDSNRMDMLTIVIFDGNVKFSVKPEIRIPAAKKLLEMSQVWKIPTKEQANMLNKFYKILLQVNNHRADKILVDFTVQAVENQWLEYYTLLHTFILANNSNFISYKDNVAGVIRIIKTAMKPLTIDPEELEKRSYFWAVSDWFEDLCKNCKSSKIQKEVSSALFDVMISLYIHDKHRWRMMDPICEFIIWKGLEDRFHEVFEKVESFIELDGFPWKDNSAGCLVHKSVNHILTYITENNMASKYKDVILQTFVAVLKHDIVEETEGSLNHLKFFVLVVIGFLIKNSSKAKIIEPFMSHCIDILLNVDDDDIKSVCQPLLIQISSSNSELLVPYVENIISCILEQNMFDLFILLDLVYLQCSGVIEGRIADIMERFDDLNGSQQCQVLNLLSKVEKRNVMLIVPFVDQMHENITAINQTSVLSLFYALAPDCPHALDDKQKLDKYLSIYHANPYMCMFVIGIIMYIGGISEERAKWALEISFQELKKADSTQKTLILTCINTLKSDYMHLLEQYKPVLVEEQNDPTPGVKDICTHLLDTIEGRTLQNLSDAVTTQGGDISELDTRVTDTEVTITAVGVSVMEQAGDIAELQQDIDDHSQRIEQIDENIDEIETQVDDIDKKTVHNAPTWSRDVSKLLNPESDADWRLLAVHLNYSAEDIRAWATTHDPTMSLLAEWYAVHKTSNATYAIVKCLREIGQTDAVSIIEDSLKDVEDIILPPAPEESGNPPSVYITYQWDHQTQANTIRQHIEMAGFGCWMDTGLMGGGDTRTKLIDQGLRAAEVVVCVVTEAFTQSEQCANEVNLANLLNKPIIPLLIEKVTWPPPGPLSVLFSQILYIDFIPCEQRSTTHTDGPFWSDDNFKQLLGQIRYHAVPDSSNITPEYENWSPKIDTSTPQPEINPQVFISYQWDRQDDIIQLVKKLTSLGYSCWLDIQQMGGGDPLLAEIDKGIRNAKVVVSCISPKYTKSINCCREIILADCLKKPLLPIMIDKLDWPPAGSMSIVLAPLLYIDFVSGGNTGLWSGQAFDRLNNLLRDHTNTSDKVSKLPHPEPVTMSVIGASCIPVPTQNSISCQLL